jgi:hypothetical protein
MLNISEEYDRDTSPAKLMDISRQTSHCIVSLLVFARNVWWMNQE